MERTIIEMKVKTAAAIPTFPIFSAMIVNFF
jgi:hypothetical protein